MTNLFLQLTDTFPEGLEPEHLEGIAGLVVNGECITPGQCRPLPVPVVALTGRAACAEWSGEDGPLRVVDAGLDACARLRDEQPEYKWMPWLAAYRPEVVYRMSDSPGEGFRFYAPDTATIRGYRITDGDWELSDELGRARSLGFSMLWLHGSDAEQRGDGLDLDLLERARRHFDDGLWLSGGATEARHLENLAREGGVLGLVIDKALLEKADGQALASALAPPPPPQPAEAPIYFHPPGRKDAGLG